MNRKFAATVLATVALALPVAAMAPAASADTVSSGSASGSADLLSNLICDIQGYLGMGGCMYIPG